jgi:hypothetical protein
MFICKVCEFDKLEMPQYTDDGGPMFNICPCCGFQSGYHDQDQETTIDEYRQSWINKGALWAFPPEPAVWNYKEQLKNISR